MGKIYVPKSIIVFQGAHFSKTYNCSTVSRGDFLYRISPKSVRKYGKCGQRFIYTLK